MKNYIVGGIAVVALIVAFLAYTKPGQVVVREIQQLGSASSPSVNGGCMDVNGITSCYQTTGLTLASTTCSIKSPTATSTLVFGSFRVASTSATAALIEMGKGATAFATTTLLGTASLGANAQGTMIASTSQSGMDTANIFAPNTYFNVKNGSGIFQYAGKCETVFRVN